MTYTPITQEINTLHWFQSLFEMGDLDFQVRGQIIVFDIVFGNFELVNMTTHLGFKTDAPNVQRMCILQSFQNLLQMGDLDLHLQDRLTDFVLELGNFGFLTQ